MISVKSVVGQDSFAPTTGCHMSTVARVCEVLWQATATLTSSRCDVAVVSLKCAAAIRLHQLYLYAKLQYFSISASLMTADKRPTVMQEQRADRLAVPTF